MLTYDELQRKYGELVARLNKTEEFRKGRVLQSSLLCDLKWDLDQISSNLNRFSTELWTNLQNPKPNPPNLTRLMNPLKVLEGGGHHVPYTLPPNDLFEAAEREGGGKGRGRRRPSRAKPKKGEPMENALEADELPEGDYPAKTDLDRPT